MWVIQTILGGDTLYDLLSRIPGIDYFSYVSLSGYNIIIYSVQPATSLLYNLTVPRNCGFAWEPGAFSVYLCLAILINLFITNFDKNSKKRFWVLVIALLSSQSTTGYMVFMVIILFYFLNKKLNVILLLLPIVIISVIYVASLPFMSNKIFTLFDETNRVDELVGETIGREDEAYTPQRFTSFMITIIDFIDNTILGLGAHGEESWTYKIGAKVSTISGIGNFLAQFGLVGFIFFIIYTIKTSFFLSKHFNFRGKYLFFIVIILISVSYSIILFPLVMSFWMFSLFEPLKASPKLERL